MKTFRNLMVLALMLFLHQQAFAASDCGSTSNDFDAIDCYQQKYDALDNELNVTYKALIAKLDKGRQKLLRESQRIWLKFMDAQAAYEADLENDPDQPVGTLERRVYAFSRLEILKSRVAYLKKELALRK
jgi:uncharacterized protein YecT (DUF1311 family)